MSNPFRVPFSTLHFSLLGFHLPFPLPRKTLGWALLPFLWAPSGHPDWLAEPGCIRGAFLSCKPSEKVAADLRQAGLTEPCYYFNACYERVAPDPDNFRIQWKAEPRRIAQEWEQLARRYDLNLLACINSWAGDEGPMFEGKNYRHLVTVNGRDGGIPCPTDRHYWDVVAQQMEMIADLGPGMKGCLWDTETYNAGAVYPGYGGQKYNECYCDHCFGRYLTARGFAPPLPALKRGKEAPPEGTSTADLPPPTDRFPWLAQRELADDYEGFMEEQMVEVGQELGTRVRARHEHFVLGILNTFGWHSRGLVRGWAQHGDPVLVWGENTYWRGYSPAWDDFVKEYQALGPRVLVAGGLALAGWGPQGLAYQGAQLSQHAQGYWLFCANSLFATRQQQEEAQSVWRLKVLHADRYLEALGRLNQSLPLPPPSGEEERPSPPSEREEGSGNLLKNLAEGSPLCGEAIENRKSKIRNFQLTWPPFKPEELLRNGGFEEDFGDLTDPQAVHRWRGYYAWPQRVPEQPHSGATCCRLENNDPEQPCSISQTLRAQPGQSYRLQGYFRTAYLVAGQGLHILLNGVAAGRWRGHFPEWTPFQVTTTCPPDTEKMGVGIEMHYTLGTVWLDDLSVTLSPRRTLLTQPFSLPPGGTWDHLCWQAEIPPGATFQVDLISPETECPLAMDLPNRQNLALLNRVTDLSALQVRVTVEPDKTGRYPIISDLRFR